MSEALKKAVETDRGSIEAAAKQPQVRRHVAVFVMEEAENGAILYSSIHSDSGMGSVMIRHPEGKPSVFLSKLAAGKGAVDQLRAAWKQLPGMDGKTRL